MFIFIFLTLSILALIFSKSTLATKTSSAGAFNIQNLYRGESAEGTTYSFKIFAPDLRQVCVHEKDSSYKCTYFDYWTNNRTGKWEKLQRENGGTEGFNFCEYFERWKVAKGMTCTRLATKQQSTVTYK